MSLNDPRWGRDSSDESTEEDRKKKADPDQNDDQGKRDQDDEKSARKKGKTWRDLNSMTQDEIDKYQEKLEEKFSRLVSNLFGFDPSDDEKERKKAKNRLKSRDDFSLDEDDEDDRDRQRAPRRTTRDEEDIRPSSGRDGGGNNWHPPIPPLTPKGLSRGTGIGMGVFLFLALAGWAATGFYIVPEGQTGIVTTFGRYSESTAPGFRWHVPMPVQTVQLVDVSSVRTAEIGSAGQSDRLREALMLTDDENIVDMQFTVQYRIKPGTGARDYVFNIRQPERTVVQAAESAMREVVGRKTMDSVLFESKAEIADAVRKSMQDMLDKYTSGIEIMSVAIQNAQPPQQVQAAFNDAVKAGQDRERSINLGEEYRNAVLPRAQGTAARLKEDALGYQARVTETARGDAARFEALQTEYAKAPEVTRDRLYIDAVKDIFARTTKIYVDSKNGNNMLYLPLEKILEKTKQSAEEAVNATTRTPEPTPMTWGGAAQQSGATTSSNYGNSSPYALTSPYSGNVTSNYGGSDRRSNETGSNYRLSRER